MGYRIGIDVGGTFTHAVLLGADGALLQSCCVPTTHSAESGVAEGVTMSLKQVLSGQDASAIETVVFSTTQATNALLEGDVSGVHLVAIAPREEALLVQNALRQRKISLGGGHSVNLWPKLLFDWEDCTAEHFKPEPPAKSAQPKDEPESSAGNGNENGNSNGKLSSVEPTSRAGWDGRGVPDGFWVSDKLPVALVQPLAGKQELREQNVAGHYRACGHSVICASEITQVLGLKARARTAAVNASMLPLIMRTADFLEQALKEVLPNAEVLVVRSDGGAMSLGDMRSQPVHSVFSGPAAGAGAAIELTGKSEMLFLEVGGTSTDLTLVREGRVRQRSAVVGGQRLMVDALDLRTEAAGGGSMLAADASRFGPRSAHIAGLPYVFQALAAELSPEGLESIEVENEKYLAAVMSDGTKAAITATDYWIADGNLSAAEISELLETEITESQIESMQELFARHELAGAVRAMAATVDSVMRRAAELIRSHKAERKLLSLALGGGGAPVYRHFVAKHADWQGELAPNHRIVSAIGTALAVGSAAMQTTVAEPSREVVGSLKQQLREKLTEQGIADLSFDVQYDPLRQVLTVRARGARPYEGKAQALDATELDALVREMLADRAEQVWKSGNVALWRSAEAMRGQGHLHCALDRFGRSLWLGRALHVHSVAEGEYASAIAEVIRRETKFTDGGPVLPGLAYLTPQRFIPLDFGGDPELVRAVLDSEQGLDSEPGCIIVREEQ